MKRLATRIKLAGYSQYHSAPNPPLALYRSRQLYPFDGPASGLPPDLLLIPQITPREFGGYPRLAIIEELLESHIDAIAHPSIRVQSDHQLVSAFR